MPLDPIIDIGPEKRQTLPKLIANCIDDSVYKTNDLNFQ